MNKIIKLTFILFLVCAVTAGILGVVNELTKDRIEAINIENTNKAYQTVLAADGFTQIDFSNPDYPSVKKISKADNGAGYVVETTFSGAQGMITMACGVDNDLKCTGISIIKHSETSGLGANAASAADVGVNWRAQFPGEGEDIALTKAGGNIDALAGATITSRTVTAAVAESIAAVKEVA